MVHMSLLSKAIFDRNRKDELPALQLEWIDKICKPLYEVKNKTKQMNQIILPTGIFGSIANEVIFWKGFGEAE